MEVQVNGRPSPSVRQIAKRCGVWLSLFPQHPRLFSDNGPCYLSGELKKYLKRKDIEHVRGAPYHPMTQGKIERYHRSMKNVGKLQNYEYPWDGSGDLSSTAVVYAGTHAIEATLQPDLSVTFDSAQFDVSPYDYLVFFVHGGDAADQDLYVEMMAGGEGVLGERAFLVDYMGGNALDAGAWMVAVVPLGVINPGGALMDWFDIGDASGNGASGFHIDEIRFVASGQ